MSERFRLRPGEFTGLAKSIRIWLPGGVVHSTGLRNVPWGPLPPEPAGPYPREFRCKKLLLGSTPSFRRARRGPLAGYETERGKFKRSNSGAEPPQRCWASRAPGLQSKSP